MLVLDGYEALGTKWWIEVFDASFPPTLDSKLTKTIHDFQQYYSRFEATSLVSELNRNRVLTTIPYDLRAMLDLGMHVEKASEGVFSLLIGHHLEVAGYDSQYSFTEKDTGDTSSHSGSLSITDTEITLSGNVLLDLGGVGKGYLIKKLAQELREVHHIQEFLINGGGDLYATMEQGRAIPITIEHPLQKNIAYKEIELYNSAVCVSSPIKRSWTSPQTGKTYSHIVDRQQGAQLHRKQGSIVTGKDPAICDALATTACLIDPEAAQALEKECDVTIEIVQKT